MIAKVVEEDSFMRQKCSFYNAQRGRQKAEAIRQKAIDKASNSKLHAPKRKSLKANGQKSDKGTRKSMKQALLGQTCAQDIFRLLVGSGP